MRSAPPSRPRSRSGAAWRTPPASGWSVEGVRMLRYGYLPSDFNPMLLFLGEPGDLRGLASMLERFAREPSATELAALLPGADGAGGARVLGGPATGRARGA